ncbi:MAG: hypothetical protein AB8B69_13570 [Chitinophagales bacterium]
MKDYDSDGFEDILLIGNLFHSEIETPRNDAGLVANNNDFLQIFKYHHMVSENR